MGLKMSQTNVVKFVPILSDDIASTNVSGHSVTNQEFLSAVFRTSQDDAHVTGFLDDPSDITSDRRGICWAGGSASEYRLLPGTNQYFTISTFNRDDQDKPRRRKALYKQTHCVVLDDVREKLSIEVAQTLPAPSWVMETSAGSEQWGYILTEPCTDAGQIDNLNDGLIASDLAPDGKDPGQRGITRYVRLPEGVNTKASKRNADGSVWNCRMLSWQPWVTVTLAQIAAPFAIDLHAARRESRVDGAAEIPDHPLLNTPHLEIKEARSAGRFDVTCPWVSQHTGQSDDGTAIFTNDDGSMGFKCHHGTCQDRTGRDLMDYIEVKQPGFRAEFKAWQFMHNISRAHAVQQAQGNEDDMHSHITAAYQSGTDLDKALSKMILTSEQVNEIQDPEWLYPNLIIRGHLIVIPAAPNAGKTTIFFHIAEQLVREYLTVYYVNADIGGGDVKEYWARAHQSGVKLLTPDYTFESMEAVIEALTAANNDETSNLNDIVFIFDTLKKMTDVINKQSSKKLYKLLRSLTAKGATIVLLAHTNKYNDEEGRPIFEGTGDLRADVDEMIYLIPTNNPDGSMTVSTDPEKIRGDFQKISFEIKKDRSVVALNEFKDTNKINVESKKLEKDREYIDAVLAIISDQRLNQSELVSRGREEYGISSKVIRRVLTAYANGNDGYWSVEVGPKNAKFYQTVTPSLCFL